MPIGILGKFMQNSQGKEQNLIHLPAEVHFGVAACICNCFPLYILQLNIGKGPALYHTPTRSYSTSGLKSRVLKVTFLT